MNTTLRLAVLSVLFAVVVSQSVTSQVFDAAISYMLNNENDANSLKTIAARYFEPNFYPKPTFPCGSPTFPAANKLSPLVQQIISQKMIIFGANSITNIPKRYNASAIVGSRGGLNYYKVIGYEADIGQAIANVIAKQYNVAGGIQAYFSLTPWYGNKTNNIISNLKTMSNGAYPYDFIISGMTATASWDVNGDGKQMVTRSTLIDFTCPYQDTVNSVVKGLKPLPQGAVTPINVAQDMNQTGIIFCAQPETDLETTTIKYFSAATIYRSPNIVNDTLNLLCHAYISPIINALYDSKTGGSNLQYIGPVGQSAGPISIGLRMESTNNAATLSAGFSVLFVLLAIFLL